MIQTLFGIKKNMTSTYDSRGRRVGATVVSMNPNLITQTKTAEGKDGYNAIQFGLSSKKSLKKPQIGHLKRAGSERQVRWFREIKVESMEDLKPGQEISLNQVFSIGDSVKVTGTSKGKGFQGGMRRHGFHGGPRTHGQSDRMRAPGSIGSGTTPGRVLKGKRMAGHMGDETISTKNLEVVKVDKKNNLLVIKGAVPGATGELVMITRLGRMKGYTPPPEEKPSEEEEQEAAKNEESVEKVEGQVVDEASPVATDEVTTEVKEEVANAS